MQGLHQEAVLLYQMYLKSRTWERSKRGHALYAEWRELSTFQMQRMFSAGCFFENMATGSKRNVSGYGIKEPGGENKTTAHRKRGAEDKSFTYSSLLDVESYTTEEWKKIIMK